ncbi:hypothetical protein BKE38_16200 [Pseudoroseomonas deserti]|uniref:Calcium-binding protein n=1 Tax=Teichococcus deserti TaxID=1817963 RepID=A0A1V2H2H8_9PROT|nr:calcium-binding protein [Pseudoroseomonas deserti]ONG51413.1 hypothetical protein BKE38_16200 [Pseudoroseomonas deserti]
MTGTANFGSHFTLIGTAFADYMEAFSPKVELQGGGGDDILLVFGPDGVAQGGEGDDILIGGNLDEDAPADSFIVLNGGAGADEMLGLGGNIKFVVDNPGDVVVVEAEAPGYHAIISTISYALDPGQGIEKLQLASRTGSENLSLTGNEFDNWLAGNAGANLLDGGAGDDVLEGKRGDDTYYVDSAGDRVIERPGQGYDTVITTTSYTLEAGQSIELLKLDPSTGRANYTLVGNELDNRLWGNSGSNQLWGGDGDDALYGRQGRDKLYGGDGDDLLDGGRDGDWLTGGAGADTFLFRAGEANGDRVLDFCAAEGDRIRLLGYGTLEDGVMLSQLDHQSWRVVSVDRSISEDIFFLGGMPALGDFVLS